MEENGGSERKSVDIFLFLNGNLVKNNIIDQNRQHAFLKYKNGKEMRENGKSGRKSINIFLFLNGNLKKKQYNESKWSIFLFFFDWNLKKKLK